MLSNGKQVVCHFALLCTHLVCIVVTVFDDNIKATYMVNQPQQQLTKYGENNWFRRSFRNQVIFIHTYWERVCYGPIK